jgi:hypothetical protein
MRLSVSNMFGREAQKTLVREWRKVRIEGR